MPCVCVHGALRQLAGGAGEHKLQAASVLELLRELEREHPALGGWIVDERGLIRQHINVFVNGERGGRPRRLPPTPASRSCPRSQEAEEMTELLVSTKKGLFALSGEPGGDWEIVARAFAGEPVDYAVRDPRTRRVLATMTSPFYGPRSSTPSDRRAIGAPPSATRDGSRPRASRCRRGASRRLSGSG